MEHVRYLFRDSTVHMIHFVIVTNDLIQIFYVEIYEEVLKQTYLIFGELIKQRVTEM